MKCISKILKSLKVIFSIIKRAKSPIDSPTVHKEVKFDHQCYTKFEKDGVETQITHEKTSVSYIEE